MRFLAEDLITTLKSPYVDMIVGDTSLHLLLQDAFYFQDHGGLVHHLFQAG